MLSIFSLHCLTVSNADLPSGTMQIVQEGRVGRQDVIVIRKYKNELS